MERRHFLAVSVTITTGVFAGCGNPGEDNDEEDGGEEEGGEGEDGEDEGGAYNLNEP